MSWQASQLASLTVAATSVAVLNVPTSPSGQSASQLSHALKATTLGPSVSGGRLSLTPPLGSAAAARQSAVPAPKYSTTARALVSVLLSDVLQDVFSTTQPVSVTVLEAQKISEENASESKLIKMCY